MAATAPSPSLKVLTREEVAKHNKLDDAWVVVNGRVYDVTACMKRHPPQVVLRHIGGDISQLFFQIHSKPTQQRLLTLEVGRLGTVAKPILPPPPSSS